MTQRLRVLLLQDPRFHHDARGGDVLLAALREAGFDATLTRDVASVTRLADGKYNCLVLYTQGDTFDPAQVEALWSFVRNGGALVGVHSATATNKTDDNYARLLGSRFAGHGPVIEFTVHVSDPHHPIAHRIQEFRIVDELYLLAPFSDFKPFLTAWWNGKPQPLAYTKTEGDGRVVYLANGHDPRSLSHPVFKQLLARAVRYACQQDWAHRKIKVAAVGYGGTFNMGKLHLDSCVRAGMIAAGVCDLDQHRADSAKNDFGKDILTCCKVEDLLGRCDADLCVIITPHNTHAELSIKCLQAGRHVVTEKPYTLTIDEATRVIETARSAHRMATVFHNRRWDGDFLAIKKIIDSGAIGEVFHIECAFGGYAEPSPQWWRSYKEVSGGALYDWGAHFVDWVLQLIGHKIESVSGDLKKLKWHQVSGEDHAMALIRFAGGHTAMLEESSLASIQKSRFRILGTLGGIEQKPADREHLNLVTYRDGSRVESRVPVLKSDWDAFYRNVADHLILGEPLAVTPESARKVIAVISLARQSAEQNGTPLPLPFDQDLTSHESRVT